MNLVEKIGLVIAGPYSTPVAYAGDLLWLVALNYQYFTSPLMWFVCLSVAHIIINLTHLQQRKLIQNGAFGEANPETTTLIQEKATRDGIKNVICTLVTHFPVMNAFCEQKLTSCEIIVSHHWFETPEGTEHLDNILEHEFAHARAHHMIKRFLTASALFCIGLGAFLYLMTLNLFPEEHLHICNALTAFCIFRVIRFLQAWYHRTQEFEADGMALTYASPAKLAACLTFMRKHNPGEKILENIPEWARATHPYISSRIQKLLR